MEDIGVDRLRNDVNFGPLDTGCGEDFAMKVAWEPQLVECVATSGPAVRDWSGRRCGTTDTASAVEGKIPADGIAGLVEDASGEFKTVVKQALQVARDRLANSAWVSCLQIAGWGDLDGEVALG